MDNVEMRFIPLDEDEATLIAIALVDHMLEHGQDPEDTDDLLHKLAIGIFNKLEPLVKDPDARNAVIGYILIGADRRKMKEVDQEMIKGGDRDGE